MTSLYAAIASYIGSAHRQIAITGSGGKTTTLVGLAAYYAKIGHSVLVSTTTKVHKPSACAYHTDYTFTDDAIFDHTPEPGSRTFYALEGKEKALAPALAHLQRLASRYTVTLLEADGARGKALKIHSERDPVIPPTVTATIAVFSLAALGKSIREECFGCPDSEGLVDIAYLTSYLNNPDGPLKRARGRKLILANQCDRVDKAAIAALRASCPALSILFGSAKDNTVYYSEGSRS